MKSLFLLMPAAALFLLSGRLPADAAVELQVSDVGGPSLLVPDTFGGIVPDTGSDRFPSDQAPGLTIIGVTATSNNPGTATMALLSSSIQSITNTTTQTRTLTITVSQTGFALPATGPLTLISTTDGTFSPVPGTGVASVDGTSVTSKTFADASNASFGTGFPAEDFTGSAPANAATFAYSDMNSVPGFNPSGLYSLTIQETFTLPGNTKVTDVSATLQALAPSAVPEPSALALLIGMGLTGAGLLKKRGGKLQK